MEEPDDDVVRVTMRSAAVADEQAESMESDAGPDEAPNAAVDEWEVVPSGEATVVDPEALSKLRDVPGADDEAKTTELVRGSDFAAAAEEFAAAPDTVMENVEQLSAAELMQLVEEGGVGAAREFEDDSVTRMDPRGGKAMFEADGAPAKEECPHCGVMVLPGYPNCPRCKRPLLMSVPREHVTKGATSLGGRTIPWAIVAVAAICTAVIVYLAEREPKAASDTSGAEAAETQEAPQAQEGAAEPGASAEEMGVSDAGSAP